MAGWAELQSKRTLARIERRKLEKELYELEEALREAEARGLVEKPTFLDWMERRNPRALDFEHIPKICEQIDWVIEGFDNRLRGIDSDTPTRVMTLLPPRYLKSELFSRQLPAYFLRRFTQLKYALVSYGADLAWELSEEARENFMGDGGQLSPETTAKRRWATLDGGELWATGMGGPMLGRGYHCATVDDPIDPEKVRSPVYIKRFKKWWPEKFMSRQEPFALIFFVMQRLGVEDPVSFLWAREMGEAGGPAAPEKWHVIAMDEIKSNEPYGRWKGPQGLPDTCTLAPDNRKVGDVLSPTRFTKEQVAILQRSAGPWTAASQRQQRPMRPAGDYWQEKWFKVYDKLPADAYNGGRDWDTAYTKNEANAASAWIKSFRGPGNKEEFPIYIHDVDWDWLDWPSLIKKIKDISGPHFVEAKATGKSVVQALQAENIVAEEVKVAGDKFARANAVQPAVSNGRVWVNRLVYDLLMTGEGQGLLRVTAEALQTDSGGLDVNDVFVQCLHRHLEINSSSREVRWA